MEDSKQKYYFDSKWHSFMEFDKSDFIAFKEPRGLYSAIKSAGLSGWEFTLLATGNKTPSEGDFIALEKLETARVLDKAYGFTKSFGDFLSGYLTSEESKALNDD